MLLGGGASIGTIVDFAARLTVTRAAVSGYIVIAACRLLLRFWAFEVCVSLGLWRILDAEKGEVLFGRLEGGTWLMLFFAHRGVDRFETLEQLILDHVPPSRTYSTFNVDSC